MDDVSSKGECQRVQIYVTLHNMRRGSLSNGEFKDIQYAPIGKETNGERDFVF